MPVIGYSTYLIRHWSLPDRRERIEIRHIQSGAVAHFGSLDETLAWIGHHGPGQTAAQEQPAAGEQPNTEESLRNG